VIGIDNWNRENNMKKFTTWLWFDGNAEEAAEFYTSVFKNSEITGITYYGKAGAHASGQKEGTVMTVTFRLDGQEFMALNGGPVFKFSEAVSFVVNCENQEEIDYYWEKLSEGGDEKAQVCGWLKDKFGLSWQIVPTLLDKMLKESDTEQSEAIMQAFLKMKKLDIGTLKQAYSKG
jgi:predicted 3-demethylubiquinone-9 3-methyltransferase (glyoxalase superfamily)